VLAVGAAAALAIGWTIPAVVERVGEMIGGALLIVLGLAGVWLAWSGRVYGHAHPGWHLHLGRPERHALTSHSSIGLLLGAAFAVSSLRALAMLAPFGPHLGTRASSLVLIFWLIAAFAIGIIVAMSLFGILLARVMDVASMARLSRAAGAVIGLSSIALGLYWMGTVVEIVGLFPALAGH
jgi:hypothetical protein